jgi:hypothetical protein
MHRWNDIYYKSEIPHRSLKILARSFCNFPVFLNLWITSRWRRKCELVTKTHQNIYPISETDLQSVITDIFNRSKCRKRDIRKHSIYHARCFFKNKWTSASTQYPTISENKTDFRKVFRLRSFVLVTAKCRWRRVCSNGGMILTRKNRSTEK